MFRRINCACSYAWDHELIFQKGKILNCKTSPIFWTVSAAFIKLCVVPMWNQWKQLFSNLRFCEGFFAKPHWSPLTKRLSYFKIPDIINLQYFSNCYKYVKSVLLKASALSSLTFHNCALAIVKLYCMPHSWKVYFVGMM